MDPASDFESDEPTERCIEPVSHILAQEPVEEENETDRSEGEETEAEVEDDARVEPETPRKRPRTPTLPEQPAPRCARRLSPELEESMPSPVEAVDYAVKYLVNAPFSELNRHQWWRQSGRCERNLTFLWGNLDQHNRSRLVYSAIEYYRGRE